MFAIGEKWEASKDTSGDLFIKEVKLPDKFFAVDLWCSKSDECCTLV